MKSNMCRHNQLPPSYWDIYPPKKVSKIILGGEDLTLEKKSAVKLERQFCRHKEVTYHKILMTSTLMPETISDYILEKEGNSYATVRVFKEAWKNRICEDCIS